MANFLLKTTGLLGGEFEWSYRLLATAAVSEATLNSALADATTALWTDATNGLQQFCNADVTLNLTEVFTLSSAWKYQTGSEVTHSIAGTNTHDSLPWSDAEVVTLRTNFRTKSGHGRIFLPSFSNDQVVSHVIIPGTVTKMVAGFATYFNALATAGADVVLVNMKPLKDGTAAFTTRSVTRFEVVNKPSHQRRRVSKLIPGRSGSVVP